MNPKKKEEEIFLESFNEHSDAIFRFCFFKVSNYDLARDLSQETFMKVWKEVVSGKEIKNHKAFLYRVATNLVIDYYRKKKEMSLDRLAEDGFDPKDSHHENESEDKSEVRILKNAVNELDEKYRDVVLLRYIEEMSPKEIALVLDLTENVISVRIHRGLKQLREKMGENK